MEGLKGAEPPSQNYERFRGEGVRAPLLQTSFGLDKFITMHFYKGEERKSTLLSIEEECYNTIIAFSFI